MSCVPDPGSAASDRDAAEGATRAAGSISRRQTSRGKGAPGGDTPDPRNPKPGSPGGSGAENGEGAGRGGRSVFSWIWRSYLRTALVPLVFIELVFLIIYLASHGISTDRILESFGASITQEFRSIAGHEAGAISQRLDVVAGHARVFAAQTGRLLTPDCPPDPAERDRLALSPEGVLYTTSPAGGRAAVFYSGAVPIGETEIRKAVCSAALDPLMRDIQDAEVLVDQIYLNTWDSLNRIYPYFDVLEQYAPGMVIPEFNFYYEADAEHNPDRKVVWTDVYLDPAGKGWMASAIAPVYQDADLAAVVGLDVTVGTFIDRVLTAALPFSAYGILLDRNGALLALPDRGARDWGIDLPREGSYQSALTEDTFLDPDHNLFLRTDPAELIEAMRSNAQGILPAVLNNEDKLVAWARVEATGWTFLLVANHADVFGEVLDLDRTFTLVGYLMAGGLLLFYFVFLGVLYGRARVMAAKLAGPLTDLNGMIRRIARGHYYQSAPDFAITELRETGAEVVDMGNRLGAANEELIASREDLVRARDAAQAAARAKAEFLATMSHEIRTPLNAVIGLTGLMLDAGLEGRQTDHARAILRSGEHLLGMVNDILDFSRIDTGSLALSENDISLAAELHSAASLCGVAASAKGLPLSIDLDPALAPGYRCDSLRLRQILLNLIGNAVKFTDAGAVRVRAEVGDHDRAGRSWVSIHVSDTGPGIPDDRMDALFTVFQQLDTSSTRRHGGTGLGLAISRRLAQMMGGDITVRSTPGEGSTFTLAVPLIPLATAPGEAAPGAGDPAVATDGSGGITRPLRVLVAEDIPENQILSLAILEKQGHEAVLAVNGREAVDQLLAPGQSFDLVLLDIQMPVMDGVEACRTIRALPDTARFADGRLVRKVPLIAFTADALPGDRDRFLAIGMDEHLTKPLNGRRLKALLADVAAGRLPRPAATAGQGGAPGSAPATDPAAPPRGPLLRSDALAQLRQSLGEEFLGYLDVAEESMRHRAKSLPEALVREDFQAVGDLVHGLRGTLGAFGMDEMADLCLRLRGDLMGGAGMAVRGEVARLTATVLAAADEVAHLRRTLAGGDAISPSSLRMP